MCGSVLKPKTPKVKDNSAEIAKKREEEARLAADKERKRRSSAYASLFDSETGQLGVAGGKL